MSCQCPCLMRYLATHKDKLYGLEHKDMMPRCGEIMGTNGLLVHHSSSYVGTMVVKGAGCLGLVF